MGAHRSSSRTVALVLLAAALAGCSGAEPDSGAVTLETLIDEPAGSPMLTVGDEVVVEDVDLVRREVTYPSGDLTIAGLLAEPGGEGPHPALVVLHGYERGTYDPLRSMAGYYGPLVEAGYVVLLPHLRNYAGSDADPEAWSDMNMGGTRDAVNAVRALAALPQVDPERVGVVGLSEGGRLALTTSVVVPDALAAVVAMSPMSADAWDNVERFMTDGLSAEGFLGLGTPETAPDYWRAVDPGSYADRTSAPLLVVQAGADETCDPAWAAAAVERWQAAGRDATLLPVAGASHVYEGRVDEVMAQVVVFLDEHV